MTETNKNSTHKCEGCKHECKDHKRKDVIKNLYLYGISGISLLVMVFGWGHFLTEILYNAFDLKNEWSDDIYYKRNLISTGVTSTIATILFIYHWRIIKKEDKSE